MNTLHYIILIFIVLILIAISFTVTKETFITNPVTENTNPVSRKVEITTKIDTNDVLIPQDVTNNDNIKIVDNENDGHVLNEYINFAGFEDVIDPNNQENIMKCKVFETNSSFIFSRPDLVVNNDFSCGFFFKPFNTGAIYNYLFSAEDKNGNEILRIDLNSLNITVKYHKSIQTIPISTENSLDNSEFSYLFLKGKLNFEDKNPSLSVIYNNKDHNMTIPIESIDLSEKLSVKRFIFGNKAYRNSFEGLIGKILIFNNIIGRDVMCQHYNCNLICYEPNGKNYSDGVNGCIRDCFQNCGDIIKCQQICVSCEVEGKFYDTDEKFQRCPWLSDIKILDRSIPDAAVIRGFPGDRKILIEWKKPFDGRSEITNYIILYYESFNKKAGINVSISTKTDLDILEYELKDLKNKTYYDIEIRAVNSVGIGKPSNIITVAPNGSQVSSNNRNIFSELDEDLQKEVDKTTLNFMCESNNFDSVGHTLDFYDNDTIDVKSYIKNLK